MLKEALLGHVRGAVFLPFCKTCFTNNWCVLTNVEWDINIEGTCRNRHSLYEMQPPRYLRLAVSFLCVNLVCRQVTPQPSEDIWPNYTNQTRGDVELCRSAFFYWSVSLWPAPVCSRGLAARLGTPDMFEVHNMFFPVLYLRLDVHFDAPLYRGLCSMKLF